MNTIEVVAGALVNDRDEILLAQRPAGKHLAGLWEFPGGKREAGETWREALDRELDEELDIRVEKARPLIRIRHDYDDRSVILDVWVVSVWSGQARGREGQPVEWVLRNRLGERVFPAADKPVLMALSLPDQFLITPSFEGSADEFLAALDESIKIHNLRLIQLRTGDWSPKAYGTLARDFVSVCHANGAKALLNADPRWITLTGADGVHLSASRLRGLANRPLPIELLVSASCHNEAELRQAGELELDFAVLSPVNQTATHPTATPLGWGKFEQLTGATNIPVYALGGLQPDHRQQSWERGGQGIAAIRSLWSGLK